MFKHFAWMPMVAIVVGGSQAQEWGDLTGKFVYGGMAPAPAALKVDKDVEVCGKHALTDESLLVSAEGGLANVVLFVRTKNAKVHPELESGLPESVILDNKDCHFIPHVVALWAGKQQLKLSNSDPVGHNSNVSPPGDVGANPLLAPMTFQDLAFKRAQNIGVPVTCNIHPWMKAYVIIRDNPYVAISAADGTFTMKNLPAGELEFQAWHEKSGYVEVPTLKWEKGRFKMKIAAGENKLGPEGVVKLDPKMFQK